MNEATPKGLRLHLGIFGRRNAGKSTLLNAVTRQNVSIVSDVAGTTTDTVEKRIAVSFDIDSVMAQCFCLKTKVYNIGAFIQIRNGEILTIVDYV